MYGKNANIEIRMETQVEKWAFFRENVHRSFNYSKFSNYARGFVWLVIIPVGVMSLITIGQRDGEVNNFQQRPSLYWPETSIREAEKEDRYENPNSPVRYSRISPGRH